MVTSCEVTLKQSSNDIKFFCQKAFFDNSIIKVPPHSHMYSEFHLICGNSATFNINGKMLEIKPGEMLVIPKGISHCVVNCHDLTQDIPFLVNFDFKNVLVIPSNESLMLEFISEIKKSDIFTNPSKVNAYLSFFFSFALGNTPVKVHTIRDYKFLIFEFFSLRYSENIQLSDLAEVLHLSERQTERLVIEHTGRRFREMLIYTRISKAKEIAKHSGLSMQEIAFLVGYQSYSGFWKSMKKYENE